MESKQFDKGVVDIQKLNFGNETADLDLPSGSLGLVLDWVWVGGELLIMALITKGLFLVESLMDSEARIRAVFGTASLHQFFWIT